ncbi:MAG: excinuclease ABC subunit A, partial [Bacteroidota bacterium]|nr:excinuclease ABC subunit A [Bacteroidota bacterium]
MTDITNVDPKHNIIIKGAKLHNLKNIDVVIPRNKLVVITGLSGSGKSSLAFDTLYAEGQRRYVESLSSYARQFLGKLDKPKVDYIKGIAPAIAIEQKVNSTNPRSTVGTTTEIYDYLKLLYARIGKTISPISGKEVKKHSVSDVMDYIKGIKVDTKLLLLAPIAIKEERDPIKSLELFSKQGYARIKYNGNVIRIDQAPKEIGREFDLVVDRIIVKDDEDFLNRLANAVDNAFFEGKGECAIENLENGEIRTFSNQFELDGIKFLEPNVHLFSFNNPYGACPKCEGYGDVIGIDEDLVIPNTALSVYENAVFPWRGESMGWYRDQLVNSAYKFDFPIHKPWFELSEEQKQLVWEGNEHFIGIHKFFEQLEEKSYKIQNRVMLSRYRGKTKCTVCKGKRLRVEANYVKVGGKSLSELIELPIRKLVPFFEDLQLS